MSGVAALLLAAGEGRRMGRTKQLMDYQGRPLVVHALAALQAGTGVRAHMVVGAEADVVADACAALAPVVVRNADWRVGMGRSLAVGMAAVLADAADVGLVLIALADQPLIRAEDYAGMLACAEAHPGKVVAAAFGGRLGAPVVLPAGFVGLALAAEGDVGLRGWLAGMADAVVGFDLPAAGMDLDVLGDLAGL